MKRKIIKISDKTLVVSLPSKWVKENNLSKEDELDITLNENNLIISTYSKSPILKTATINVSNISERVLRWEISSLHKQGYDEIIVLNYTPNQLKILEDLIQNLFIGFIIKEKTQLKIIVGQIAVTDEKEFDSTLRRAFRQLIIASDELLESFQTNNLLLLSNSINLEHENNKLTNFCERLLNKSLKDKEKGHFWYVIVWNLEKIVDNFKYIYEHYKANLPKINEPTLSCLKNLNKYIKDYYDCFYDFSFEKLTKLNESKQNLEKNILNELSSSSEFKILFHYMHLILLQVTDFSTSTIALKNTTLKHQ